MRIFHSPLNQFSKTYNFTNKQMHKCEHGEKIVTFCATECCAWKEAGGCSACMKKYHNHMGPTVYVSEEEVIGIIKKYGMDAVKPKCRVLQDLVQKYFNNIKNEFSTFIDAISNDITNYIWHPYLAEQNLIPTYKYIKKKQYRKIQQKDFRSFYEASTKKSEQQLLQVEKKLYRQKILQNIYVINKVENLLRRLESESSENFTNNFKMFHDGVHFKKITEIMKNLFDEKGENYRNRFQQETSKKKEQFTSLQGIKIRQKYIQEKTTQNMKKFENSEKQTSGGTKVSKQQEIITNIEDGKKEILKDRPRPPRLNSLDKQFTKKNKLEQQPQLKEKKINQDVIIEKTTKAEEQLSFDEKLKQSPRKRAFDRKQSQINEKKQKLIDMMKVKEDNHTLMPVKVISREPKEEYQVKIQKSSEKVKSRDLSGDLIMDNKQGKLHLFAHTALPRSESRKKLFEQTEQVAQQTILVPVSNEIKTRQSKEIQSPLLKNRMKEKKRTESTPSPNIQKKAFQITPKKIQSNQKQSQLDENRQKSLTLLIKSIKLKIEEAIPYLETSLDYADDNISSAEYLSYLYLESNRPKDCLNLCNRILEKLISSPDEKYLSLHLRINQTAALNVLGRYSEAIVILQQCLISYQNQKLYKNLGDSYFSIGIYEKAIYNYERAVNLSDTYDQAHYNLAVCLFTQENFFNAKFSIEKALAYCPKNQSYQELQREIQLRIKQF